MEKKVVVTRHPALVAYLLKHGVIEEGCYTLLEHATINDVINKEVIGVLPLSLAYFAKNVTEVPLNLTAEQRGKELTLEEVEEIAGTPVTYVVKMEE